MDLVTLNNELAGKDNNNLANIGSKGFLIEGEIGMGNFTYFPVERAFAGEGADEVRQFLNLVGGQGDVAEENLEEATAEAEAA